MIIKRDITGHLKSLAQQFPVVAVMGPRQSGKTTLVRETFPDYTYVTLEDLDRRALAKEDPRGFFATYAQDSGLIIDEIQEVPELFSYMQGIVDQAYRPGYFIVTGSQHFLMYEKITQTLAGRIALLTLLPLSVHEIKEAGLLPDQVESLLIKGCYPRLYAQPIDVHTWVTNYISTYVEKDVRQVLRIIDVMTFQRFLKLCAARVGNILNYASIARDADISPNTAKEWISILEASYIIKLLYPYYNNFNKRVIKSPKLYFYDSALVCSLLGIRTAQELQLHSLRGALFESFVVSELFKYNYNNNELPNIYFWRDVQGHEIDVLIEKSVHEIIPVEIKAGMTVTEDFFKALGDWRDITDQPDIPAYIVYGGHENSVRKKGLIYSWNALTQMLHKIYQ
ncbi:MAG: ATP-binding protein [Candidatus Babeliaceae bacterium]|jgi:hypothetical protein